MTHVESIALQETETCSRLLQVSFPLFEKRSIDFIKESVFFIYYYFKYAEEVRRK